MPKPKRQFRCQAIILSRRDFGEADRLLTLFTATEGKRRAIAKGARKPSAKLSGHVELFTRSDCLLYRGRNLDILRQADMLEPYLGLREDLTRGAYANYIAELLDRFTAEEEEASGALFTLLDGTLTRIANGGDPRLAARYFELQLLDLVGFRPELGECVITREALLPQSQFFSHEEGGIISRRAAAAINTRLLDIDLPTLKLLRHLQRCPADSPSLDSLRLKPAQQRRAERIMLAYITHLLERRLESVAFIKRLRELPAASP